MPFPLIPLIGLGLSAIGGGLHKKDKTQQTSTSTPTLSPQFQPLQQLLLQQAMQRLQGGGTNLQGYEAQGIGGINKNFGLADMALQNRLRSRGLSRSGIAGGADARIESGRVGAISQFQNSLPMLQREQQNEDLNFASGLLPFGRGTTTSGSGVSTSGGGAAGGFEDFGTMLGYLIGQGAFKKTPKAGI